MVAFIAELCWGRTQGMSERASGAPQLAMLAGRSTAFRACASCQVREVVTVRCMSRAAGIKHLITIASASVCGYGYGASQC